MELTKFSFKTKLDVLYFVLNLLHLGLGLASIWSLFVALLQLFTILLSLTGISQQIDLETKRQVGNLILITLGTIYFACSYYIVSLLLRLLRQLVAKKLFSEGSSRLLNKAGLLVLANMGIVVIGFLLTWVYNSYFIYNPDQTIQGPSFSIPLVGGFDITTFLFALCLLALSEIFKQGENLKGEHDLVV